jgi:NADH:ubiquinone oxidoreductase subunit 6 (subunit J)
MAKLVLLIKCLSINFSGVLSLLGLKTFDAFLVFTAALALVILALLAVQNSVYRLILLGAVSLAVVFSWAAFAEEFIYAYLAYIVAFTGAVLMLFLSVVLMLPISQSSKIKAKAAILVLWPFVPAGVKFNEYRQKFWVWLNSAALAVAWAYSTLILFAKFVAATALSFREFSISLSALLKNSKRVLELPLPVLSRGAGIVLAYSALGLNISSPYLIFRAFGHVSQVKIAAVGNGLSTKETFIINAALLPINKFIAILAGSLLFTNFFTGLVFLYNGPIPGASYQGSVGLLGVQEIIYDKQPLLLVLTALVLLVALVGAAIFMRKPKTVSKI